MKINALKINKTLKLKAVMASKSRVFKLLSFLIFMWGCSDSNSVNDVSNGDFGEVTFIISGDVDDTYSGAAFFDNGTSGEHDDYYYELIFMDGIDGPETYRFTIGRYRSESFVPPSPGTYEIDGRSFNFTATYEYANGNYSDQYCKGAFETGGELVIDSVSGSQVTGSFSFTVAEFDDLSDCNLIGYVDVSGSFRAVPYENLFF